MNEENLHNDLNFYKLVAKSFAGETTAMEEQELSDWIHRSATHKAQYEGLKETWTHSTSPIPTFSSQAAWKSVASKVGIQALPWYQSLWFKWLASGIMITSVAGSTYFFLKERNLVEPNNKSLIIDAQHSPTKIDQNTTVWVKTKASIQLNENWPQTRIVKINGDACVEAKNLKVLVDDNELILKNAKVFIEDNKQNQFTLQEGVANLQVDGKQVNLKINQTIETDINGQIHAIEMDENQKAWLTKSLNYQNTPLRKIAKDLKNQLGISIDFENKSLENLTFTGSFENNTPEEIISILAVSTNAEYSKKDKKFVLKKKK